ncbi:hypothetical protein [Aeromonas dhakensis]|uniref:hypothetical protein n=1 Tax=Aeromonas dhakensis TaxID=196024 RepID=UPI0005AB02A6|nr:hypothetical protein [Aeromonas dhakensis]
MLEYVKAAEARRVRIYSTAALMTLSQWQRAATADLGIEPRPDIMRVWADHVRDSVADSPIGYKNALCYSTFNLFASITGEFEHRVMEEDEAIGNVIGGMVITHGDREFAYTWERWEQDFADNLRIAEQCDR